MNKPEREYCDHLLMVKNYSEKTVDSYQKDIDIFFDGWIAHLHSLELLHDDVGEFLLHALVNIHALSVVANLS